MAEDRKYQGKSVTLFSGVCVCVCVCVYGGEGGGFYGFMILQSDTPKNSNNYTRRSSAREDHPTQE